MDIYDMLFAGMYANEASSNSTPFQNTSEPSMENTEPPTEYTPPSTTQQKNFVKKKMRRISIPNARINKFHDRFIKKNANNNVNK